MPVVTSLVRLDAQPERAFRFSTSHDPTDKRAGHSGSASNLELFRKLGQNFAAALGHYDNVFNSNAAQTGNNDITVAETADGKTGDALAGSQVTGDVGHSDVTVQNQNRANLPVTFTGSVSLANGESNVVGPIAIGAVTSNASQIGDNAVAATQGLVTASGDSVAGAQVTGVVAAGSTVTGA